MIMFRLAFSLIFVVLFCGCSALGKDKPLSTTKSPIESTMTQLCGQCAQVMRDVFDLRQAHCGLTDNLSENIARDIVKDPFYGFLLAVESGGDQAFYGKVKVAAGIDPDCHNPESWISSTMKNVHYHNSGG